MDTQEEEEFEQNLDDRVLELEHEEEQLTREALMKIKTTWKQTILAYLMKYCKIILPHIGLIFISAIYILIGATVFLNIERPYELQLRRQYLDEIQLQMAEVKKYSKFFRETEEPELKDLYYKLTKRKISNLTRIIFNAYSTHYVNDRHINLNDTLIDPNWTYMSSVFFASTLLTTIGYGNLVPKTFKGRLFCICYGLFGVPLILITIADLGKFLSENLVRLYELYLQLKDWMKDKFWEKCRRKRKNYDDESAKEDERLSLNQEQDEENPNSEDLNTVDEVPEVEPDEDTKDVKDEDELNLGDLDSDEVRVPILLILTILGSWVIFGAYLLGVWEKWDILNGIYYCFITMTTVGFGDITPKVEKYYWIDLLYIIVGLGITTMCIELVGVNYIRKVHYFGRAMQDMRSALVNVGGKMVQLSDLVRYGNIMKKKYGLKDEMEQIMPRHLLKFEGAYTPENLRHMRYIDYGTVKSFSMDSIHSWYSSCLLKTKSGELKHICEEKETEESEDELEQETGVLLL